MHYLIDRVYYRLSYTSSRDVHRRSVLPIKRHGQTGGAGCSSVVRAFAHGAMGRRIDPSWGGPIELFLVPASASRLV